jgi:ADP-heptose:LPS heptosyltransferase
MSSRVLVVRADSLGDVVLSGPAVRAVAASGRPVTMLCSPAGAPAAERLPGVDDVVVATLPWISPTPEPVTRDALTALVELSAGIGAHEGIILTSSHQSPLPAAVVLRLAGVPRVGGISLDYPGSLLDVALRDDDDRHEVSRALALVEAMGYRLPAGDNGPLYLERPDGPRERFGAEPFVVVHPGASVPARTWAPHRWARLVAQLGTNGVRTLVTGGHGERALTASVASAHPMAEDWGAALDLGDLLDLLAAADVVVAGNTGPAHLAAAVGTPVVSIFPPTVPASRWRPWGVPHTLLGDQDVECAGCRARQCPRRQQVCLDRIGASAALDAVLDLRATAVTGAAV